SVAALCSSSSVVRATCSLTDRNPRIAPRMPVGIPWSLPADFLQPLVERLLTLIDPVASRSQIATRSLFRLGAPVVMLHGFIQPSLQCRESREPVVLAVHSHDCSTKITLCLNALLESATRWAFIGLPRSTRAGRSSPRYR